jgi:SAM-dependent methyltransferase
MFTLEMLERIRAAEIERVVSHLPVGSRVLEIGAGAGHQALALSRRGFDVSAIDLHRSAYAKERIFPVVDYDGAHIPFPDATFDVVFSSNVLEHVRDLSAMHTEIKRVLKPGGYCLHVLPTHIWRFWTSVTAFPIALIYLGRAVWYLVPGATKTMGVGAAWRQALRYTGAACFQPRHGERGTALTELWRFHPQWWRNNFHANGFEIIREEPIGLFYTGNLLFGRAWSIDGRKRLSQSMGSAGHIFKLAVKEAI